MGIRYYKILQGYEHERDVIIREDELERAYGLFMLGGRWIFSGGPVDGKNIQTIVEDYHSTMGWNKEYKLGTDDYAELSQKSIDRKMKNALGDAKERVQYLISNNQENLIGKNIPIPKIESTPSMAISSEMRKLSESKRI